MDDDVNDDNGEDIDRDKTDVCDTNVGIIDIENDNEELTDDEEQTEDSLIDRLQSIGIDDDSHDFGEGLQTIARQLGVLNSERNNQMINLLRKYETLFTEKPEGTTIYTHELRIIKNKPFVKRLYPVPFALRKAVGTEIQNMLTNGIIDRSTSQYCNPLRIVKRKNGAIRVCLDARSLNDIIESDNETPPRITELLQRFHEVKFISSVDLAHGYWQIPHAKESRQYTAFLYDTTLYQFYRVPFGIKTAGSGFIRALNMALGNEHDHFLTCYTIIFNSSPQSYYFLNTHNMNKDGKYFDLKFLFWYNARKEFLREILYNNIAIIAIEHSKIYIVDTFGDFSHTVE